MYTGNIQSGLCCEEKPEQKFDMAYGTMFRISKFFSKKQA
jgi:hypothetical protein